MSSEISSITCGNPFMAPKISNRQSDLSKPTIPSQKLIATSTKPDETFPSTFPTPRNGQCTIKSTQWITRHRNGEKPPPPQQMVRGFSIVLTRWNVHGTPFANAQIKTTWSMDQPGP
jgi:hypothetical protein